MSSIPSERPFIPIAKPELGEEEKAAVMAVLDSGMLVMGKRVAELEARFAELCGVKHAVAVASGTASLWASLLAHEIGHDKKRHIQEAMAISIAHTGLLLFLLSVFLESPGLFQAFYMEQQPIYAGLLFFALLYTPIELLLSILLHMISRRNEYQADSFAAGTIEEPRSLVDALKRLSATNLSNLSPHPFYVLPNYSHPPLLQRVQAIQRYEARGAM